MIFNGTYEELQEKLISLEGKWHETLSKCTFDTLNRVKLTWFRTTNTVLIQGKEEQKLIFEENVKRLLSLRRFDFEPEDALEQAIQITSKAFLKSSDKGGMPYILHCLHVMRKVAKKTDNDLELMSIAVMHDLVEDTEWTLEQLSQIGFNARICDGVRSMTHIDSESYDDYLNRIASNPDAIIVKIQDLKHNSDMSRMKGYTEKDFKRLEKYHKAYKMLKEIC